MSDRYRVNTPGPSFTITARNLDDATAKASSGLPVPSVANGWTLTEYDTRMADGRKIRRVHRWTPGGRLVTGFAIYRDPSGSRPVTG